VFYIGFAEGFRIASKRQSKSCLKNGFAERGDSLKESLSDLCGRDVVFAGREYSVSLFFSAITSMKRKS
jgi:hypothetical protein